MVKEKVLKQTGWRDNCFTWLGLDSYETAIVQQTLSTENQRVSKQIT
jgi:hypothetical protein